MLATSLILTRTISVPEIAWTLVSLFAAIYIVRLFSRAISNLRWLRQEKWNGVRQDAARISILTYAAMLFVVTANTVAGVIAMMIPSASDNEIHPLTYLITTIFVLKSVFVAGAAYMIDHLQVKLIRTVEKWDGAERRETE